MDNLKFVRYFLVGSFISAKPQMFSAMNLKNSGWLFLYLTCTTF